jgi:hypothetical protein
MINAPQQWYRPSRCNYMYVCQVLADGAFTLGPLAWTVERTATGLYTVTHDIGHTRYFAIAATTGAGYKDTADIMAQTDTDLTVATFSSSQPNDDAFQLLVLATQ